MNTRKDKALQETDISELKNENNSINTGKSVPAAKRATGPKPGRKAENKAVSASALPASMEPEAGSASLPVKKRGRPKGSGKGKGSRPDSSIQNSLPDAAKSNVLRHNLQLYNLDKIADRDNPNEIASRLRTYFELCASNTVMPTVAGMAFSLGINRVTLWDWINGKRGTIKNPDVVDILKSAYSFIESEYEDMLTNGKIIPVSAFFLMKNNFGYQDTSNLVVSANDNKAESLDNIAEKAGLLND